MSTTRDKIVETMYLLVAEKGYDRASIGCIAEAIDIKKASIYYYFKSKEEIFLSMVDWVYHLEPVHDMRALQYIQNATEYQDFLINYGDTLVDWYQQDVNLRRVCSEFDVQSNRIQALSDKLHVFDRTSGEEICRVLQHGVDLGVFPIDFDVTLNAQLLATVMHGMDRAILYDIDIDCKAIWKLFIAKTYLLNTGAVASLVTTDK